MKRMTALFCACTLSLSLFAGCGPSNPVPPQNENEGKFPDGISEATTRPTVRFAALSGPTGIGGINLVAKSDAPSSKNKYESVILNSNDDVAAKLSAGELDIAALSSSVAANLFHKTNGAIQIAAVGTLGVLHILENGDSLRSISDLRGRTIYAMGQGANPEYILRHLLESHGLNPDADVTIAFDTPDVISAKMIRGEIELCMLAVPAATGVLHAAPNVRAALDLTEEWGAISKDSMLAMGALVVRREFAEAHPGAVQNFIDDYASSTDFVNHSPEDAAPILVAHSLVPSEAIGQAAIPQCNLVCITGQQMRDAIQGYYEVLFASDPASIGNSIPDDSFYYIPATTAP